MDIWQLALSVGAIFAALVSLGQPRGLLWIAVGATDFVVTAIYQEHAFPQVPHAFVTCIVDGIVVMLLSAFGRYAWEIWVRRCFMLSMIFSVLYLGHVVGTQYVYVTSLEVANWMALIVIGGAGIANPIYEGMAGDVQGLHTRRHRAGVLYRLGNYLYAPRRKETIFARTIARR